MLLTPQQFSALTRRSRWYLFGGLALAVHSMLVSPIGLFTGCMAMLLGSCITTFDDWHFDTGRWKQTAVFFAVGFLIYFAYLGARIPGLVNLPNKNGVAAALDIACATALAWTQLRFLLTVTRLNWLVTRLHQPDTRTASLPWIYTVTRQPRVRNLPRTY